jgi:hypothetical protein
MDMLGYSALDEVALDVGIDRGTLYRYFDRSQQSSIARIQPLCETLQVDPVELLKVLGIWTGSNTRRNFEAIR